MELIYKTDLRCGKCLGEIREDLDQDSAIQKWYCNLTHEDKLLHVQCEDAIVRERVPAILSKFGYNASEFLQTQYAELEQTEAERNSVHENNRPKQGSKFSLSTYQPLFLVVGYILALVGFIEALLGSFDLGRAMAHFMGFFFLGFAFFKLLNVSAFANAFSSYDVIAARSRLYALAYPFVEVALGLLCLSRWMPVFSNAIVFVVMLIGLIGVVDAVLSKRTVQCACLGTAFNLPMSFVTIIENSVMMLMAAGMAFSD